MEPHEKRRGANDRPTRRLSLCHLQAKTGESVLAFANKFLRLVCAATPGQDPETQKQRMLEEYVSRLHSNLRHHVELDNLFSRRGGR
ncbi:unnamed protein product [Strongylus vulgaris]|uniref:Retrotransposon gag domain-containing protein n=1 Tax=Strongylus vulgaris TaxID=40348 RepID=A0A3P7LAJ8_STRVU|nr:unnamed protein product [Strongylus vulgaris]